MRKERDLSAGMRVKFKIDHLREREKSLHQRGDISTGLERVPSSEVVLVQVHICKVVQVCGGTYVTYKKELDISAYNSIP